MRMRPFLDRYGDWLLAVALIALLELQVLLEADESWERLAAALAAVLLLPLIGLRRRLPLLLPVAAVAMLVAELWLPSGTDLEATALILLLGIYTAAANTDGRRAWAAAALSVAVVLLIAANDSAGIYLGGLIFFGMMVGTPFVIGRAMRHRRQRETALEERAEALEREQEQRARVAVAEERARIARELHDVVAHASSVIVLQARGGRRLLATEPDEARTALDTIERTAAESLAEMRRLLGRLRETDEELALVPQPSLARLDTLVTQVRTAGLPVELRVEGDPAALPPSVDLSAYRIVQESLTNALKHAGPAHALVLVRYLPDGLELEIADDGAPSANGGGSGHGLLGIRERVALHGGDFEAGRRAEGGYAVRARLPYAAA
jgi:signal transduction histidine kinase